MKYRKNRYFTRVNARDCSFRAEYSHSVQIGQSVCVWLKSKKKPKLEIPEYCFVKDGKFWTFPVNDIHFNNNFVKQLL